METQKLELMSAISEMKLQQAAVERENFELKEERKRYQNIKPPIIPRNSSPALSTPVGSSRMSPIDYSNSRKSSNTFSGQDLYQNDSTSSQPNSFSDSHHKYIISSTPNKMIGSVSGSLDHQQQQNNYFTSVGISTREKFTSCTIIFLFVVIKEISNWHKLFFLV